MGAPHADWQDKLKKRNSTNVKRTDGRIERMCEHGIGHTIFVPLEHKDETAWWTHGCDGCCLNWATEGEK